MLRQLWKAQKRSGKLGIVKRSSGKIRKYGKAPGITKSRRETQRNSGKAQGSQEVLIGAEELEYLKTEEQKSKRADGRKSGTS